MRLEVVDVTGRSVLVLVEGLQAAGRHAVEWDGRDGQGRPVVSGVYFYRMQHGTSVTTRRMVIVR
ncbi:MAG: FlgD immunoglobulin-like domain containing protein [Bacteroidota bacterium]